MTGGLDSFALLAIPLFILSGQLMGQGGIAHRLIDFAKAVVGMLPGGLAFVNVISCTLFGTISGSAVAATSAIGSFMMPTMEEDGYPKEFNAALTAAASTTGLLIPPSNILIVYAVASGGVSISALFVGGYLPGILVALGLMVVSAAYARKYKFPAGERVKLSVLLEKTVAALPSLFLIVLVIGGILAGVFTATEAGAIAVLYALGLSVFIYREVKLAQLGDILLKATRTTAIVMLLVGAFLDMTPAVLIFTPIFLPVAVALGMTPLHFGIMMVLNLSIGLCTPPVGSVLFVACAVGKTRVAEIVRPLTPMYVAMFLALLAVTYIPGISEWLPRAFGLMD